MLNNKDFPNYTHSDLRRQAKDFLKKYHLNNTLPIPIEEIIEFKLKLDISPLHDLKKNFDIVGFITGDLSTIVVDEHHSENVEDQYRITLAHETSHKILHSELYINADIKYVSDFVAFQQFLDNTGIISIIEYQADILASFILVPEDHLLNKTKAVILEVKNQLPSNFDIDKNLDAVCSIIKYAISKIFVVSESMIDRRLENDIIIDNL